MCHEICFRDQNKADDGIRVTYICLLSVVRSTYADRFYTRLGQEAIAMWKDPMWEGCYHE